MVTIKIAIKGLTTLLVKKNEVMAEASIAQKTKRLTLTDLRSLGKIKSATIPTTDWKLTIIPMNIGLFRVFSI